MAGRAHKNDLKACANSASPGARWLHTCRGPVSSYRITNAHLRSSSQDSAPPSPRCGSLTKSLRMSRRGMGGKRLCTARASRGGAHGRAWVRVRASSRAVQGSGARMQPSTIAKLLEIDGGRKTHGTLFSVGISEFFILIFWENRCLGSSSGTSKSPETVPESKKTFILNEKVLPDQAITMPEHVHLSDHDPALLNFPPTLPPQAGILKAGAAGIEFSLKSMHALVPVSYTHLTLPTKRIV